VGATDVYLGSHVPAKVDGASGGAATTTGGAGSNDGGCSLPSSQGVVAYGVGEVARLEGTHRFTASRSGKCARARLLE
jgi:hypothetical protein